MPTLTYRPMTPEDHPAFIAMMEATPGVVIRDADRHAPVARYLARNPGMSHLAFLDERLVGCAMAGHDQPEDVWESVLISSLYREKSYQLVTSRLPVGDQ